MFVLDCACGSTQGFFSDCVTAVQKDSNKWIMGADEGKPRHIGFWSARDESGQNSKVDSLNEVGAAVSPKGGC